MLKPFLVAFDFDHTIIDENSSTVIRKLIPSERITSEVKSLYRTGGWACYMQRIFDLVYENGVTKEHIQKSINKLPVTEGCDDLLVFLNRHNCEIIIISDANSIFIHDWLESNSLKFAVSEIFTNPAEYDENGCLKFKALTKRSVICCAENLCKGDVLENYIQDRATQDVKFSKVAYVGDGKNDYCPATRLSEMDFVFPREGFALMETINDSKLNDDSIPIIAQIFPWNTGHDIIDVLQEHISGKN